eukprot:101661-Pelagomonas_calceolata.AAC.1
MAFCNRVRNRVHTAPVCLVYLSMVLACKESNLQGQGFPAYALLTKKTLRLLLQYTGIVQLYNEEEEEEEEEDAKKKSVRLIRLCTSHQSEQPCTSALKHTYARGACIHKRTQLKRV